MKKILFLLAFVCIASILSGQQVSREFRIDQNYLNFPVSHSQDRQMMWFLAGSDTLTYSVIRLAEQRPDYWVFKDVSAYKGQKMKLLFSKPSAGIDKVFQADTLPGQSILYREPKRPQFHFSSRRGWNNDPNGLVWFEGEYHLFYQHNPFETQWENMHWGHAVSPDLLHWTELNDALFPDQLGTMFSGSAVIDFNNTAGWGRNTMVAAYTADRKGQEVQCLAYSLDKGRTFTKYEGNPVLGPQRDPKVIWYEPNREWVMALYEHAGVSLFTSANLKEWTRRDHVRGFYECPEIFELAVDGNPAEKLWVIYGGSGSYMLGDFDGRNFTPRYGKYRNTYGAHYAAQTFNNTPDGKRVQIGWGQVKADGMPFNQMMCFPTELTLRNTPEGIRLFSEPIAAISQLHTKEHDLSGMDKDQINTRLAGIKHDLLHVVARLESLDGSQIGIGFRGNNYCTMDSDELNRVQSPHRDPEKMVFDVEILIDRTSLEAYYQQGLLVFVEPLKEPTADSGLVLLGNTAQIKVHSFRVFELKTIWN